MNDEILARKKLDLNGINATTGLPIGDGLVLGDVLRLARGEPVDPAHLLELRAEKERIKEDGFGPIHGVDSGRLEEAGWGVIFPYGQAAEIREALRPLLEHRRAMAARQVEKHYEELIYRPGESKAKFLARHGAGPDAANPEKVPYYLMIVGSPEEIPFRFQYQLDVQYAVGRLHFETLAEYERYAATVVEVEKGGPRRDRTAVFWAVANHGDRATARSCTELVGPLIQELRRDLRRAAKSPHENGRRRDWNLESLLAGEATKRQLASAIEGRHRPALLFTASHGIGFAAEDPRQLAHQGALLCQDWPGPEAWRGPIPADFYYSADDVSTRADLAGMVAFHFACYGAGTPRHDQFSHRDGGGSRKKIAPRDFVAHLPQRLLAHPCGGALAVVGHVDRAWTYSFSWPEAGPQLETFKSTFGALFDGMPVGAAMEYFNQRYACLSSDLNSEIEEMNYGGKPDLLSFSGQWTANNDARSYVVLGDPAVRLAV